MRAIVVETETKQGESNGRKWVRYGYRLQTDSGTFWASTFDSASFGAIQKGHTYEVDIEEKGNNKNLKSWVEVEGTPVKEIEDPRRSKEEMRWVEAYTAASRLMAGAGTQDITFDHLKENLNYWAGFFYNQYVTADSRGDAQNEPEKAIETAEEVEEVVEAIKEEVQPVEENRAVNYETLVLINNARVEKGIELPDLQAYVLKTFKKDHIRKLTEKQLNQLLQDIEGDKI